MLTFLRENAATIIVGLVLFCALAAIAVRQIKNKKQGKSPCGSCSTCPMNGECSGNK